MSERTRAAPAFRAPGSMGRNGEPPERPQRAQRSRAAPISVSSNDTAEVGLVRRPPHARGHVHGASIVSSWMDARLILRFARDSYLRAFDEALSSGHSPYPRAPPRSGAVRRKERRCLRMGTYLLLGRCGAGPIRCHHRAHGLAEHVGSPVHDRRRQVRSNRSRYSCRIPTAARSAPIGRPPHARSGGGFDTDVIPRPAAPAQQVRGSKQPMAPCASVAMRCLCAHQPIARLGGRRGLRFTRAACRGCRAPGYTDSLDPARRRGH